MKRSLAVAAATLALTASPAAAAAPPLDIDPHVLNFGQVEFETFTTRSITITNTSSEPVLVVIDSIDVPDDFSPGQPESTCPFGETLLQPGESCTHVVGFSPSETFKQPEQALISIAALDPETREVLSSRTVKMRGRGVHA